VPRELCEQKFRDGHFIHVEAGKDWGFTNPGVTLVGAMTSNGELWIVDAIYKTQMEILIPGDPNCWVAQDKELMKKWKIRLFWCDEEDPSNIKTYQTNGLPARPAKKHLKQGIRAVSTLFTVKSDNGRPNIFISDHLKDVIQELTNYRYPEDATGDKAEIPLKENDHAMDALRYLVWNSKVFHQLLIARFNVIPWKISDKI
jgi:phage terminase large subunit